MCERPGVGCADNLWTSEGSGGGTTEDGTVAAGGGGTAVAATAAAAAACSGDAEATTLVLVPCGCAAVGQSQG